MNTKNLVNNSKTVLSQLGHEIPTGHLYELFSRLCGYKDWNTAKTKVDAFVIEGRNIVELLGTIAHEDSLLTTHLDYDEERELKFIKNIAKTLPSWDGIFGWSDDNEKNYICLRSRGGKPFIFAKLYKAGESFEIVEGEKEGRIVTDLGQEMKAWRIDEINYDMLRKIPLGRHLHGFQGEPGNWVNGHVTSIEQMKVDGEEIYLYTIMVDEMSDQMNKVKDAFGVKLGYECTLRIDEILW